MQHSNEDNGVSILVTCMLVHLFLKAEQTKRKCFKRCRKKRYLGFGRLLRSKNKTKTKTQDTQLLKNKPLPIIENNNYLKKYHMKELDYKQNLNRLTVLAEKINRYPRATL